jgi:hypothetical protein
LGNTLAAIFGFLAFRGTERHGTARLILYGWLVLAPLPAALTIASPHLSRSATLLPALALLGGAGLATIFRLAARRAALVAASVLLFIMLAARDASFYLQSGYPFSYGPFYQKGYQSMSAFIRAEGEKYRRIVITDQANQPYILFLVYLQYPPERFQNNPVLREYEESGWQRVTAVDRFVFCDIPRCFASDPQTLYIGRPDDLAHVSNPRVLFSNGHLAAFVVENR